MAYDSGIQNPDGSLTFTGPSGSLTTAPTPSANAFLETLQRRQAQSAPLAANGPARAPLVLSDAPLDMSAPSLPPGGAAPRVGFYGNQGGFTPDAPAPPPGSVVPGLAPGAQISFGAGGQANVAPAGPPTIESGVPDWQFKRDQAIAAQRREEAAARGGGTPAPAVGNVAPGELVFAQGAGGGKAGGPGARGRNSFDDAEEEHRLSAEWERKNANRGGGGSGPKPGAYQTGQTEKTKTNGGKDPDSVLEMAEANREKEFADRDAAQAAAAHEADVQKRMEFERFLQQGADDNLARKRKEAMDTFHADLEAREKEINETSIDPDHFWADKSTGAKIGTVIAAALTGYLNGKAGIQGNQVLTVINKRIDEDINAQIRNLGNKKEGLTHLQRVYQQAKEKWGDEGIARNQAKIVALTAAEKTARQQATLTKSEAVAAEANKFYSGVANEKAKLVFNSQGTVDREVDKTFKVVSAGANGTGGAALKNPHKTAAAEMDKAGDAAAGSKKYNEEKSRAGGAPQRVVVGGTTYEMQNTGVEEGGKVRTKLGLSDVADRALDRVEKRYTENLRDRTAMTASAAQENDVGVLTESLSVLKDQGMIKESDVKRMTEGLLSPFSGKDTIASTRALINDSRRAALTQGGAVPVKK